MQARQTAEVNPAPQSRTLLVADPVRPGQSCVAQIDALNVRLTRRFDNMTMYLALALRDYSGIAVREVSDGQYALQLAHVRTEFSLELGQYDSLEALEQACIAWRELTSRPLLIETESGNLIRVGAQRLPLRRKGTGSALTYRRGNFAKRRRCGEQRRMQDVLTGWREIIASN